MAILDLNLMANLFSKLDRSKFNKNLVFRFSIPVWIAKSGLEQFSTFRFEYGHHAVSKDDAKPFFGRVLYLEEKGINEPIPVVVQNLIDFLRFEITQTIDSNSKFLSIHRIAINGQTPNQSPEIHIDNGADPTAWTAIYYANYSDGDTIFYQSLGNKIECYRSLFEFGTVVLFPASFCHKADSTLSSWRITAAITFFWDCKLNNLIRQDL